MNIFKQPKLLAISQLNEKCQVVIPKDARDAIGIGPGDRVVIALAPFGSALVIAKPQALEAHLELMVSESRGSVDNLKKEIEALDKKGDK